MHLEVSKFEYASLKVWVYYFEATLLFNSNLDNFWKQTIVYFPSD